jgi:FkbM family methyltransferase
MFRRKILNLIFYFYSQIFARKSFYLLNMFFFHVSLRGLGILNYENSQISGERNFLKKHLKILKNPVIFDIGANRGTYILECLEMNSDAKIYAFEPHPENFKEVGKLADKYGFSAINRAVGSENKKIKLYDYKEDEKSTHASVYKEVVEDIHKKSSVEYEVEMIKLDDFVKENKIERINLLKIDVEGNEFEVLKGAETVIEENKIDVIQWEFNEMNVISRVFLRDFINLLENYKFYRLLPDDFMEINYKGNSSVIYELFAFQNIIAIRNGVKLVI